MHKKRDNSLAHGFMRFAPTDDCSRQFGSCHLNGKSTHYHCLQVNCSWQSLVFLLHFRAQSFCHAHQRIRCVLRVALQFGFWMRFSRCDKSRQDGGAGECARFNPCVRVERFQNVKVWLMSSSQCKNTPIFQNNRKLQTIHSLLSLLAAEQLHQGLHQHVGRDDARELPQEESAVRQQRLRAIPRDGDVRNAALSVFQPADHSLPLHVSRGRFSCRCCFFVSGSAPLCAPCLTSRLGVNKRPVVIATRSARILLRSRPPRGESRSARPKPAVRLHAECWGFRKSRAAHFWFDSNSHSRVTPRSPLHLTLGLFSGFRDIRPSAGWPVIHECNSIAL